MRPDTKIATCCYCGSRTILKLTARQGHELACGSCGAPVHELKWLKKPAADPQPRPKPARFASMPTANAYKPRKQKKRRKTDWKKRLEKAWDVLEDIFD